MLWSIGKDSTVLLWLAKKAFYGHCPFPFIHVDTSFKMPEMYAFRDKMAKEYKIDLIVHRNEEALALPAVHSEADIDKWEAAARDEDDARAAARQAKADYEDALRKEFFNF